MKWTLLSLCILGAATPAAAQEPVTIPLAFEKKLEGESRGIIVLFEYDRSGHVLDRGERRSIVAPALEAGSDVAYGYVYFVGRPEGALARKILFLVEGYLGDEPRFHVDGNNNLDLTDDAPAVRVEEDTGQHLLTLHPAGQPEHQFTVRLRALRREAENMQEPQGVAKFLGGYIESMGGTAVDPRHWLAERRLNVMSASTDIGGVSFQIGVHDRNCDGVYNEPGVDAVLVGEFEGKYLSRAKTGGASILAEETLVRAGAQTLEVLAVDAAGKYVRVVPSDKPFDRLLDGMRLPDFELTMMDGSTATLGSFAQEGKYLLIDFWGFWCTPCIASLPVLKAMHEGYAAHMVMLGIHSGDRERGRESIASHELKWPQAIETDALKQAFMVESYPRSCSSMARAASASWRSSCTSSPS